MGKKSNSFHKITYPFGCQETNKSNSAAALEDVSRLVPVRAGDLARVEGRAAEGGDVLVAVAEEVDLSNRYRAAELPSRSDVAW